MDDKFIHKEKLKEQIKDDILKIDYKITYQNIGEKEASFSFNVNNQLTEFSLFNMEVKTMKGETTVKDTINELIEVPFKLASKLIMVTVKVNGTHRQFLLDTGAPKVIVNSKYFPSQEASKKKISSVKGVGGAVNGLDIIKLNELDFYGIKLNEQEVLSLDLSHLEDELETPIYGLIGFDLVKEFDILFDYDKRRLTFLKPDYYEDYANQLDVQSLVTIPMAMNQHIPTIDLLIGKEVFKMGIDSGAESNLLSEEHYKKVLPLLTQTRKDTLIGADNSPCIVDKGVLPRTFTGKKELFNMETLMSDISHLNLAYKANLDGLVGYQMLSQQKTLISFKRKEVVFID